MALDLSSLDDISALIRGQDTGKGIREVRVDAIQPDPNQPRKAFDEGALAELAESIQSVGIIQPPVVRTHDGGYLLISGERRWRAARQLGWEKIDVIVRDDLNARAQLVENIQREALSPWEIYRVVVAELDAGTTQADLARALGKSGGWVGAYAAVGKMPQPFVTMLREGRIADITALGHLFRLHKDMPDAARQLLDSTEPVTRPMITAASTAATRQPSAALNLVAPETQPPSESFRDEAVNISPTELGVGVVCEPSISRPLRKSTTAPTSSSARPLPIHIRANFEGAIWTVDYTRQQGGANGSVAVMLEGEDGSKRYAPLGNLRLQSIEFYE